MEDSKIFIDDLSDLKESSFEIEIKDLDDKLKINTDDKENTLTVENTFTKDDSMTNDNFVDIEENIAKINEYLDNDKKIDEMIVKKMNIIVQKLDKYIQNEK